MAASKNASSISSQICPRFPPGFITSEENGIARFRGNHKIREMWPLMRNSGNSTKCREIRFA